MAFNTSPLSQENVLRDVHDPVTQTLRTTAAPTPGAATEAKQDAQIVIATATNAKLDTIITEVTPVGVQYNLNGTLTTVLKDTTTPSNSRPLPVELTGASGPINITAGDLNVQLSDQGANPDVTKIGDGTNRLGITASSEAKVSDSAARTSLASIDAKLTAPLNVGVSTIAAGAGVQVIDSAGTNKLSVGTAGNILVSGLSAVGAAPSLNPVSIAGIDGSGNKQHLKQITGTNALVVDGSAVTQPVSVASLPLPAGSATSALQTTGNTSLSSMDTKTPALGQALAAASTPVVLTAAQLTTLTPLSSVSITGSVAVTGPLTDTQLRASVVPVSLTSTTITGSVAVTASALPLPAGAATETTLAAVNTKLPANLTVSATRLLVDSATSGRSKVNLARIADYNATPVTTAAYVQVIASTSALANMIEIFDSSGETLVIAFGGSGSEVDQMYLNPGGNGLVPLLIPASTRVSVKAVSNNISTVGAYLNLTLYS